MTRTTGTVASGRVLVTGSEGVVGRRLTALLRDHGYDVLGLDIRPASVEGVDHRVADLMDLDAIREATKGVGAIVHAGGIPTDSGDGSGVMEVNVMGTWNVLQAAVEAGVGRFVGFSSVNAQGSVGGRRAPEQFPIDDDYPHHPMSPYQLSKHLMEEVSRSFSECHGIATICLRPTFIVHPDSRHVDGFGTPAFIDTWRDDFWAYVDVRDVGDAVIRSLRVEGVLHDRFLLAAADTSVAEKTQALIERDYAAVPWLTVAPDRYFEGRPHRSVIDCDHAAEVLGWHARYSWRESIDDSTDRREVGMHITAVKCILTAPAGVGLVVVKVETSEPGLHGVGCATFTQRPLAVRTVVEEYLEPLLVGRDPHCIEDIWQLIYQNAYWRNGPVINNALSGVDQALWDIKGKVAGLPLYELFGGKVREGAAVYAHAEGRDADEVLDRVLELQASGLRHIRCQVGGYGGVDGSQPPSIKEPRTQPGRYFDRAAYARSVPELFERVRDKVGFEVELLHDVHERLAPIDAVRLAKDLEPYRLFYLEDPFAPEDQAWLRELRAQSATPIAMGELFTHPLEWLSLMADRLIDFIRVHISDVGGITPARKLAAVAESYGVRTAFHGPSDVSPVGHAANLHLDLALPNFGIQEFSGFPGALREVFPGAPEARDGYLYPADGPGLGIDIDEEVAQRFPIHADVAQFTKGVVEWTQTRLPDGTLARP